MSVGCSATRTLYSSIVTAVRSAPSRATSALSPRGCAFDQRAVDAARCAGRRAAPWRRSRPGRVRGCASTSPRIRRRGSRPPAPWRAGAGGARRSATPSSWRLMRVMTSPVSSALRCMRCAASRSFACSLSRRRSCVVLARLEAGLLDRQLGREVLAQLQRVGVLRLELQRRLEVLERVLRLLRREQAPEVDVRGRRPSARSRRSPRTRRSRRSRSRPPRRPSRASWMTSMFFGSIFRYASQAEIRCSALGDDIIAMCPAPWSLIESPLG